LFHEISITYANSSTFRVCLRKSVIRVHETDVHSKRFFISCNWRLQEEKSHAVPMTRDIP